MEENKRGIVGQKGLLATLIILVIAIIGLVIGVIVVGNRSTGGGEEEIVLEDEEGFGEDDSLEDTMASAEKLLENNEVAKMKALYAKKLEQMMEEGAAEEAILEFVLSEVEILGEAGYKEDALKLMLDIDCGTFEYAMNQYVCLSNVANLAEELGEKDVMNRYDNEITKLGERTGIIVVNE